MVVLILPLEGLNVSFRTMVQQSIRQFLEEHYHVYAPIQTRREKIDARDRLIQQQFKAGKSIDQLAKIHNVTPERIYQILGNV